MEPLITTLLGDLSPERFLRDHYQKLPHAAPGAASGLTSLAFARTLARLLDQDDADVLVSREGTLHPGSRPTADAVPTLLDDGWTLLVRHAERHDPAIGDLARAFHRAFDAPVDVHLYVTPPAGRGFTWHCDVEEVFVLQTEGAKTYTLRRNTTHPWPLPDAMPPPALAAQEPSPPMRCTLAPGDVLYIPCGWWHAARATTPSTTLAVGIMAPPATALLDHLPRHLRHSLVWRRRLPPTGTLATPDSTHAAYRQLLSELADDLTARLRDPELITRLLDPEDPPTPPPA